MLRKIILLFFIIFFNLFISVNAEEVTKINSINFDNSDNIIFLGTSTKAQYINVKMLKLSKPDRLVFDIEDSILTRQNSSWSFNNSGIEQVKLSQFSTEPNVVRMVISYNKNFNPHKLKLYKINNNLLFVYNKKILPQINLRSVYNDNNTADGYYDYSTFTLDTKSVQIQDGIKSLPTQAVEIQKAFDANGELNRQGSVKYATSLSRECILKSAFTVNKIDVKRGNALIRGVGNITIEAPFIVTNPKRLVFDLPNTYVNPEIRNKEFILSENETIKIGQFEPTKARIVVTSEEAEKYRPIYSYDSQSIFLAHDDRILGLKLFDKTSAIYTYQTKKYSDTQDALQFIFTEPVIHSIKKYDSKVEINLYNASGFDHEAYKKALYSEVMAKLRTEALPQGGIKLIIPIKKTTKLHYQQSFDNKQLRLTVFTPKEESISASRPKSSIITKNPKIKTIVIDAGHGGTDVGATRDGHNEKDLTLDMSQRLATILKKKGLDVLMVRDTDVYVSLEDRVAFSENYGGDLFVSIHVNSSVTEDGHGIETHYYTPQSYDFAQVVHREFASQIKSKDRGLFKSKFYVINHTTCPSILVETGFISNPEERAELLTKERRQKTAEAIAKGILKYLGKD